MPRRDRQEPPRPLDGIARNVAGQSVTVKGLRQGRALTQSSVADALGMDQSEVSRLERRSDLLLSTLRRFVRATGGELRLVVEYPDAPAAELVVGDGAVNDHEHPPRKAQPRGPSVKGKAPRSRHTPQRRADDSG